MSKIPVVKPKKLIKVLQRTGFVIDRVSGSHYILYDTRKTLRVSIPYHNKPLKRKTLVSILRQADLSGEKLKELL